LASTDPSPDGATADPLVVVKIGRVSGLPRLAWAEGCEFSLPAAAAGRLRGSQADAAAIEISPDAVRPAPEVVDQLRSRQAYTDRKPGSSRLPFSYRRVPGWARSLIATGLGVVGRRRLARTTFPRWPLDLSADFAAELFDPAAQRADDGPTPVMLTHDLDSPEGLRNAGALFAGVEEEFGARSAHYVVPCDWPLDDGLLSELKDRGHEIGVHGFDHSNRTPFAPAEVRRQRLAAARPFIERYDVEGYRAPSLLRTRALLEDLAPLYRYDSSIPTSGGLFPVPGNGCATARPYRIGGLVELPVSLPRDGSLLFLRHRPAEILDIWISAARHIRASGGVIVLLTHCEARFSGNPAMLESYRRFLEFLSDGGDYRFVLPRDFVTGAEGR
jgi:peptidoglycan/xylan/chitin deacetylase (PgdA/CDA1 family)